MHSVIDKKTRIVSQLKLLEKSISIAKLRKLVINYQVIFLSIFPSCHKYVVVFLNRMKYVTIYKMKLFFEGHALCGRKKVQRLKKILSFLPNLIKNLR